MTLEYFLLLLMIVSIFTGLVTEGIKKLLEESKKTYKANDMIPSSRTQKYKNLLGGILCPEKVKLMQ